MTADQIAQTIIAVVALGGFFLSMRSTSYNELKTLYDSIRTDFDEYKEASDKREEKYEKQIEEMEDKIKFLTRYISKLIAQLKAANITPESMDDMNK